MNFLPSDWLSFLYGMVFGVIVTFFTGFFKKLGEDAAVAAKDKVFPKPPEPIRVSNSFVPELYESGTCVWVREPQVYDKETEGYTFYPHPKEGAKCFRIIGSSTGPMNEYLMVSPGAKRKQGA